MINNSEPLSSPRPTPVRYLVLAALCFAAVLAYILRGWISVPKLTIGADLGLDEEDMDQVLSAFFLGYALFQIPGGWLGDRWGTRLGLSVFLVIWSTAAGLMALATGFTALFLLQLVNGMAQAGIFPCCVKTFSRWFPISERAFPNGMLGSFMSVGGALCTFLTGYLLLRLSWQHVVVVLAIPGLLFAGWFYYWFRDQPDQHSWVNEAEKQLIARGQEKSTPHAKEAVPWKTLLTSARLGLICGQQFFRAAAYIFYTTQFPTFLQKARGMGESESGYLTAFPLFGVVLGSIVGGLVMDYLLKVTGSRTLSRKGVALVGTLGSGLFLLAAFFTADLWFTLTLVTASTFCAGLTGPAGYTITIDQGGRHVATVFSLMNTAGNIGATILPVAIGAFARWQSWDHALLLLACLYGGAALCWTLLPVHGGIIPQPEETPVERMVPNPKGG